MIAYIFVRDCGATTDFSTNIAIGEAGTDPADASIVFTADSNRGLALQDGKAIWVRPVWQSRTALSIAYAERARLFKNLKILEGVAITYRATSTAIAWTVP